MKLNEIKDKARCLGIKPGKLTKVDLIHSIQHAENNQACYGQSDGNCIFTDCCFIDDCHKVKAKVMV